MGKSSKKPRKNKLNSKDAEFSENPDPKKKKKEKDWGFDDIARSKTRRTW